MLKGNRPTSSTGYTQIIARVIICSRPQLCQINQHNRFANWIYYNNCIELSRKPMLIAEIVTIFFASSFCFQAKIFSSSNANLWLIKKIAIISFEFFYYISSYVYRYVTHFPVHAYFFFNFAWFPIWCWQNSYFYTIVFIIQVIIIHMDQLYFYLIFNYT